MFTNCNEIQANEALHALGLADCFDGVFGAGLMGEVCKPDVAAFDRMIEYFEIPRNCECVFFEDSRINLETAVVSFDMVPVFVTEPDSESIVGTVKEWTIVNGELEIQNVISSASSHLIKILESFCDNFASVRSDPSVEIFDVHD